MAQVDINHEGLDTILALRLYGSAALGREVYVGPVATRAEEEDAVQEDQFG